MSEVSNLTIADIEQLEGLENRGEENPEVGLAIWYKGIRNKKLSELDDGDIAKAIRQKVFLKYLLPETINRIGKNPTLGSMYDGEVIDALAGIDEGFWMKNVDLRISYKKLTESIMAGKIELDSFNWTFDDDREQFDSNIKILSKKLNSY